MEITALTVSDVLRHLLYFITTELKENMCCGVIGAEGGLSIHIFTNMPSQKQKDIKKAFADSNDNRFKLVFCEIEKS